MSHSKSDFQESWLAKPEYSKWLARGKKPKTFGCIPCKKYELSTASMGVKALDKHAEGTKHGENLKAMLKNRSLLGIQTMKRKLPADNSSGKRVASFEGTEIIQ